MVLVAKVEIAITMEGQAPAMIWEVSLWEAVPREI